MRFFFVGTVMLALGACAANPPKVTTLQGYRDPDALIGVTSRFEDAKFDGLWYVRAQFDPGVPKLSFRLTPTSMRLGAPVCDVSGLCGEVAEDLALRRNGKGRFTVTMPSGEAREFWVLWVDEGFRTAVLGNRDGTFGWIVDRSTTGGADRIAAAREILDFNGYDVRKLRMMK
ncbi:lipocalin family protein [Sulfitobacter guttiformis]|uniref:Apolipoprotein D and lipocalin family protein n=1 Tax=Sulfitobacter guttiformis TaxID=74349 RepID=A0A420DNW9_9RHOB|nr:lipocalin family protein [Sulfitobacter guttiformis]KIN73227.1 putative lipocalin-like domain protein [Sulfitobacter guttiformis KCTC 32187]RKE95900.1 apolipoprotein D and lipocalin family protein [Sulfitobacter guttiformis]